MGRLSRLKAGGARLGWFLAILCALGSVRAEDAPPCLKDAFGQYCLGGDVNALAQIQPLYRESEGDSLALVFQRDIDQDYVMAYKGQIYKVLRAYRVTTQVRFDEVNALLREKYGPGENRSQFPDYASSPSRRLASIRRGEGQALLVWHPSQSWHIELSWTREMGIALAYIADAIEAERTAALGKGL